MAKRKAVRYHRNPLWKPSTISLFTNVCAILTHEDGSKDIYIGKNIVTNQGDRYYAATAVALSHASNNTADFRATGYLRLGVGTVTPAKTDTDVGSAVANGSCVIDTGYPKVNDTDPDNTGAGSNIITWRFSYGTLNAVANNITEAAITGGATGYDGGAAGTALTRFLFANAFNKTNMDTLKVFVNHQIVGTV